MPLLSHVPRIVRQYEKSGAEWWYRAPNCRRVETSWVGPVAATKRENEIKTDTDEQNEQFIQQIRKSKQFTDGWRTYTTIGQCYNWPLDISQSLTFLSAPPVATSLSTGLHFTALTSPSWASCIAQSVKIVSEGRQPNTTFPTSLTKIRTIVKRWNHASSVKKKIFLACQNRE